MRAGNCTSDNYHNLSWALVSAYLPTFFTPRGATRCGEYRAGRGGKNLEVVPTNYVTLSLCHLFVINARVGYPKEKGLTAALTTKIFSQWLLRRICRVGEGANNEVAR